MKLSLDVTEEDFEGVVALSESNKVFGLSWLG